MNYKRLFLFAVAVTMLTGCAIRPEDVPAAALMTTETVAAPLDAAGVWEKMSRSVDGRTASSFTDTIQMGGSLQTGMMNMEAEVTAKTDVMLSEEPYRYYASTNLEGTVLGQSLSEAFRIYSGTDGGEVDRFFERVSSGDWYHHSTARTSGDFLKQYAVTTCSREWFGENLTMETQELEGEQVYVLKATFAAKDVLNAISSPLGEFSFDGLDVTGLQLEVTYYVDRESFLPLQIGIAYRGIGEVLEDLVGKYAGKMMGSFLSLEVTTYRQELSNLVYGPVSVPAVPEKGIRESREAEQFNVVRFLDLY